MRRISDARTILRHGDVGCRGFGLGRRERLVTEAATMEELVAKLKVMIPELLEANGLLPSDAEDLPFRLTASLEERTHASTAA